MMFASQPDRLETEVLADELRLLNATGTILGHVGNNALNDGIEDRDAPAGSLDNVDHPNPVMPAGAGAPLDIEAPDGGRDAAQILLVMAVPQQWYHRKPPPESLLPKTRVVRVVVRKQLHHAPEAAEVRGAAKHEQLPTATEEDRQALQVCIDLGLVDAEFIDPKRRLTPVKPAERGAPLL
jgi:hypothetical protein